MPLLRKGVLIPSKGIDWSVPETFIDDRSGYPKNMTFARNEIRKRAGKSLYGSTPMSSQVMGLSRLELNDGAKYLIRNSKTQSQKYNVNTSDWEDISNVDFTGGDTDYFSYTTATEYGYLIVTNGVDAIRKWNGITDLTALGGSPPKAKYCSYLSPYLILGYVDDGSVNSPWKVQWWDPTSEDWNSGNAGSLLLSDEQSEIKNLLKLNNYMAVYKQDSLCFLQKVGPPDIFLSTTVRTGIGLAASRCVVDAEGIHYFMGDNDFYQWNGGQPVSIGRSVRDEVFMRINRELIDKCFAVHIKEYKEIWFFIVITGDTWPKEVWKFNYGEGLWYYDTCSDITTGARYERSSSLVWDDMEGVWDDWNIPWDSAINSSGFEDVILGDSSGKTLYLNYANANDVTTSIDSYFISKAFTGDRLEFNKRWLKLDVWARGTDGAKLYIDYSTDYGQTWNGVSYNSSSVYIPLTNAKKRYSVYFDVVSETIMFRFRNSSAGEIFYLTNFYPYYIVKEQLR